MADTFHACRLPWEVWPWGVTLSHSDTDVVPECSVEFGGHIVRPQPPYEQIWVRLDFELAGLARARPHRDDEDLGDVTGYDIVPRRRYRGVETYASNQAEWRRTGWCPDPDVYYSTDSAWLADERDGWAYRQRLTVTAIDSPRIGRRARATRTAADAVHFIVNGRDGFVEVMAAGFTWTSYEQTAGPRIGPGEVLSTGIWEP